MMIEQGNTSQDEKDTDTFLTGANVEDKKGAAMVDIDNFENS